MTSSRRALLCHTHTIPRSDYMLPMRSNVTKNENKLMNEGRTVGTEDITPGFVSTQWSSQAERHPSPAIFVAGMTYIVATTLSQQGTISDPSFISTCNRCV